MTLGKGRADYLELGDNNAVCYECGRKRKASTLVRHWQGYFVCREHWEPRQQQDFVRNIPDVITPPWAQPASDNIRNYCTSNGVTAIPWFAVPSCCIPNYVSPYFDYSQVINSCVPYIVLVDEQLSIGTDITACTALVVEATFQMDGIIRIM